MPKKILILKDAYLLETRDPVVAIDLLDRRDAVRDKGCIPEVGTITSTGSEMSGAFRR